MPSLLDATPIGAILDIGSKILDRVIPDPAAKAQAQLELLKMNQTGELAQLTADTDLAKAQIDVNAEEAKNPNLFVSGARPFILWGCGFSLLYVGLFEPIARFVAQVIYHYTGAFPVIDTTITLQVLLGLLGLGGLRSWDKRNGVASK